MKRSSIILLLACMLSVALWAQAKKGDSKHTLHKPPVYVYLGHSSLKSGPVSKYVFDSLLKEGLTAKDSLGRPCSVSSFLFSYAERNFYEDSLGTLTPMMDYMQEECLGDTISRNVSSSIYDRTKAGDTVYIENILVRHADSSVTIGKSMEFFLKK